MVLPTHARFGRRAYCAILKADLDTPHATVGALWRFPTERRSTGGKGGAVEIIWTPEFFWRMFETTGSISAYLIYRQLKGRYRHWIVPILN